MNYHKCVRKEILLELGKYEIVCITVLESFFKNSVRQDFLFSFNLNNVNAQYKFKGVTICFFVLVIGAIVFVCTAIFSKPIYLFEPVNLSLFCFYFV